MAKTMAGSEAGKNSGSVKAQAVSCTQRARLPFPMGHSHRHLKTRTTSHRRVGATAACTSCNPGVPHCGGAGVAGNGLKDLKEGGSLHVTYSLRSMVTKSWVLLSRLP